jgi:hypothetical protein
MKNRLKDSFQSYSDMTPASWNYSEPFPPFPFSFKKKGRGARGDGFSVF